MKAFLLAAGLGKRLRPLTTQQPKPLLDAGGCSLIEHHLKKLKQAGVSLVVINTHWLAEQLRDRLGDGSEFGLTILWSHESELLDTGGGIYKAREVLGNAPFILASADIYSDLDYRQLVGCEVSGEGAHLVLVPNPEHNPEGDFTLVEGRVERKDERKSATRQPAPGSLTYSGIALVSGAWVQTWHPRNPVFPLVDKLWQAADRGHLSGQLYQGYWTDAGTLQRLNSLRSRLETGCS